MEYQDVESVNLMKKRKIDEAKVNLKIKMQYLGKISQFFSSSFKSLDQEYERWSFNLMTDGFSALNLWSLFFDLSML